MIGCLTICVSLSPPLIDFLVFPPTVLISNQPSAVSSLCATALPSPPPPLQYRLLPPAGDVKTWYSFKTFIKQNTVWKQSPRSLSLLPFLTQYTCHNILEDVCCVERPSCDGHNRPGQMASPPPTPPLYTHICMYTHTLSTAWAFGRGCLFWY